MTGAETRRRKSDLVMEYDIDAAPEKVWRAISIPAFREKWLPEKDLADTDPISSSPGEEVCYRMRDSGPPFLESIVTFQVSLNVHGGTRLRILHDLADARVNRRVRSAANSNVPLLMRAA